jgi:hypothetical protein
VRFNLIQNLHNSCGNKLRTYRLFKDQFVFEPYLNWGTYNQRNILTKFRISSHKLEIEKGRYMNIPAEVYNFSNISMSGSFIF